MNLLVVLHPTPFCNLNCSYCWAPDRQNTSKIDLDAIRQVLEQAGANDQLDRLDLCWLTGEPMTMGIDHFKAVVAMYEQIVGDAHRGRFVLQTNGTLINERWAEFFKDKNFTVGVSIDGPQHIHDAQRLNWSGRSTFDKTLAGIELLKRHGVRGGALCVITKTTIAYPADDLFAFFVERGIAWSYLIAANIGANKDGKSALTVDDKANLTSYLSRLMDLWGFSESSYIRDFDQTARRMFGDFDESEDFDNLGCLDILNLSADGTAFWGNPELMSAAYSSLNNLRFPISTTSLWDVRKTPPYIDFETLTHRGVARCRDSCDHFKTCRGGNPAHKLYENGNVDSASHLTCELNDKTIASLMLSKMNAEILVA